jgi:hypothetical protein
MADEYRVALRHPVDIATGASFAPGETAVGVNPKDPHDKQLIDEGHLVLVTSKGKEGSK